MTLRDTLADLAGDEKVGSLTTALVELKLNHDGSCLEQMIEDQRRILAIDAAVLLHLLDRQYFAENAVRARFPEMWRAGE